MLRSMRSMTIIIIVGLLLGIVPMHSHAQAIQVLVRTIQGGEVPFELASNVLQARDMAEACANAYAVDISDIDYIVVWPPNVPNPTSLGSVAWYCESSYGPLMVSKSNAQIACDYATDVIKEVYGGWWFARKFLGWVCVESLG